MDDTRIAPDARALKAGRRTEGELIFALYEDESRLGRPHTPRERDAFTRGFFGTEYAEEIRHLAAAGLLDEEDGQEGA